MAGKKHSKGIAAFLIILLVFAGVGVLYFFHVFDYLEYKSYDFRVRLFANSYKPSDDIAVILVNQDSIDWANRERGWGWPWPRKAYAEIVDYMRTGNANSIMFDVIFSEPSVYRNAEQDAIIDNAVAELEILRDSGAAQQQPAGRMNLTGSGQFSAVRNIITALQTLSSREDDASFVQAEKNFGRTVQAVVFSSQTGTTGSWPADLDSPLFELQGFENVIREYEQLNREGDAGQIKAQFPIKELRNAAAIGNVTGWPDSDGIFRRANLFSVFDGKAVPGLSAASLLASGGGRQISYNSGKNRIEWGPYTIPVDREGRSILRFRGSLDRYIPYFAHEILKSKEAYESGTGGSDGVYLPPEDFSGKYVFFGYYAQGLFDFASSPISSVYPGVGMHITMLDNILSGDFIKETPNWVNWLALLAVIALVTALALFSGRLYISVGGTVLIAAAAAGFSLIAYHALCLWFPMVLPLAGILVSFLACSTYNYATEGSQKRFIKSAFSQYLSPEVIDQLIDDPSNLELGGKSLDMSAIFTDIQRFSSISEGLQKTYGREGPKELVNLLNLYLTEMSNIVLANRGTIDKFEGDAIIAFFGAPVPTERHAALACRAAVQMKKAEGTMTGRIMDASGRFYPVLKDLIDKGAIRPERPLYTRVGINSGEMVVGNMGTPKKMNYTIMGNAVNLAARLEGVNKQYDTGGILLSEYTREKIGDEFILRPLSRVRVVGISTPVRLYELLDVKEDAPSGLSGAVHTWEEVFAAYEGRNFKQALEGFRDIYEGNKEDLAARLYMKRCETYLASPPSDTEWDDGVDNLSSK